ncbi:MAG: hypothetical protein F4W68_03475 [Cenarchaeum sp. SB0661_bin_35]|nr:hypothetical protein [Cenarchaeum sp. SB0661_bin_35]
MCKKFNAQEKVIAQIREDLVQKNGTIAQLQNRIKELEEGTSQDKTCRRGGRNSRSYNVREYKECPH